MSADTRLVILKQTGGDIPAHLPDWFKTGVLALEETARNNDPAFSGRYWVTIGQATDDLLGEHGFEKGIHLIEKAGKEESDRKEAGLHLTFNLPGAKQLANRLKQIAAKTGAIIEHDRILMVEIDNHSKRVFGLSKKGNRLPTVRW